MKSYQDSEPDSGDGGTPDSAASSLARGTKIISGFVKRLPSRPGVYRMLGDGGAVLYVGKARNLPKRVRSYTRPTGHTHRIMRMIALTRDMEFVTTASETEALLLEANLIKQLKPQFNVLLRDDKSFPHILIANHDEAPQILKHRGARKRKGQYFGPFASAGAVNRALNVLQRAFLLRSCTDSVYHSRSRPCLLYQIKRCSAPCTGEITPEDYAELVKQAVDFLSGRSGNIRRDLTEQMEVSAAHLDFERAAIYRDRLAALSHVQSHQGINPHHVWD
ncbi:MAG: UvrB/UvrC motif-containing protein, partial [Fimbriimonadaceae bacterium]|nr:UvrB/UvrC motif-containing protein [Alphaproteobacteria bacterium]